MPHAQDIPTDDGPAQVSSKPTKGNKRTPNISRETYVKRAPTASSHPKSGPSEVSQAAQDQSQQHEYGPTMQESLDTLNEWEPIPSKGKVR